LDLLFDHEPREWLNSARLGHLTGVHLSRTIANALAFADARQ